MRRFWAGLVLLAALGLSGSAFAVIGGSPDSGHPYAGAVFSDHELCSGAFISPTAFVTAAHCFADGSTVQITFGAVSHPGSVFTTDAPSYSGTVHDDPDFCLGCGNGLPGADTGDIAVVDLDTPVTLSAYAALPAIGLDDTLSSTQTVDVVGYGATAIKKGAVLAFGTKQVATTGIVGNSAGNEFLKLQASPGSCTADSGGPNLISGTDTIAAITSFSNGGLDCNGVSYSERLDTPAAQAFIASWS
jgi:hypothetical protein